MTKYNKQCAEMLQIKATGKPPVMHLVPPQIQKDGLFQLDVDDDIEPCSTIQQIK